MAGAEHLRRLSEGLWDDPVAACWHKDTWMEAETLEHSDGTKIRLPPSCKLWEQRPTMIELLDEVLIQDRGGWMSGIRVRTHGIPPYTSTLGATAVEAGVFPDRAVVSAPHWTLDHDRHTLASGPPAGYWLRYRVRTTGLPADDSVGPVEAGQLTLDLDPHHAPEGLAPAPEPCPPTVTAPLPASPNSERQPAPNDASAGKDPDDSFQQDLMDSGLNRPATHDTPADPHERHRANALARLWQLRDNELFRAGDSSPARIAERIVGDRFYPDPPHPPNSRELAEREQADAFAQRYRPVRWAPEYPDRQLITGERREWLLQWLPEVVAPWTTWKQKTVLDGFTGDTTLTQVREFMAREGFTEVCDVHGNAGPPPQPQRPIVDFLPQQPGQQEDSPARPGDVNLVLLSTEGFLATIHAPDNFGQGARPESVHVSYNVATVDRELFDAGDSSSHHVRDDHDRLTNIRYGTLQNQVGRSGGSLRVGLAVLRAFATPIIPWTHPVRLHVGRDGAPRDHLRQVIAGLPDRLHDLLGPQLQSAVDG